MAVAALSLAGHTIPNRDLVSRFLHALAPSDGCFPSITSGWCFLNAMRLLNEPLDISPRAWLYDEMRGLEDALTHGRQMEWSGALKDMGRLLELCNLYGVDCNLNGLRQVVLNLQWPSGGYGWPGANLLDTEAIVRIYALLHWKLQRSMLKYAHMCENENLGFTLAPEASNATLAVLRAGLHIVHFFGERLRYERVLLRYILTCQTGKGGFARVPGALADMENTYIAFECLRYLGQL